MIRSNYKKKVFIFWENIMIHSRYILAIYIRIIGSTNENHYYIKVFPDNVPDTYYDVDNNVKDTNQKREICYIRTAA